MERGVGYEFGSIPYFNLAKVIAPGVVVKVAHFLYKTKAFAATRRL